MIVNETFNPEAIREAPRALVYLKVDWSGPERTSRRAFFEAVERLSKDHAILGIRFYLLDEEADPVRAFLISSGFDVKHPRGSGSLIWLESGQAVDSVDNGYLLGAAGIVERSLALWSG